VELCLVVVRGWAVGPEVKVGKPKKAPGLEGVLPRPCSPDLASFQKAGRPIGKMQRETRSPGGGAKSPLADCLFDMFQIV